MSSIAIPRPEHPNPQFERKRWRNLNGTWDFAFDFGESGIERRMWEQGEFPEKIVVPFCPESSLSGIHYTDFIPCCWYRRTFSVSKEELSGAVLLHFGAVDYEARVFVNGQEAGTHRGGYASFRLEISALLREGENTLVVCAIDHVRSGVQPIGKQSDKYFSHGCSYTRTTGIWQTVWLEFLPKTHIRSVRYYPNAAEGSLTVRACVEGEGVLRAAASFAGSPCGEAEVRAENGVAFLVLKLREKHLWQPGAGGLYDLVLTFGGDEVKSYFGLREVRLSGYRFLINGASVFQRLILDQGFYPDGIYTAPTEKALENDILLSMAAGFNGARLHQKVFEPRFLYYCDLHGYLVWGETASWGIDVTQESVYSGFLPEWAQIVERDFNHPALVGWCPFNEVWNEAGRNISAGVIAAAYHLTKQLDPTRPCIDTSGGIHGSATDLYDVHDYEQDPGVFRSHYEAFGKGEEPFYDRLEKDQHCRAGLALFVSEYGGIRWTPDQPGGKAWGYGQAPKSEQEFFDRYRGLTDALLDNPRIFGFCYTQLTDVEQECNGIYYYSRKPKFDAAKFREINSRRAAIED